MQKPKRTSMAITSERKLKLERIAIDASHTAGKTITWTDITNHMIDFYAKDAANDLIDQAKKEVEYEMTLQALDAGMEKGPLFAKLIQQKKKHGKPY